eukprot:bmy_17688T0
MMALCEAVVCGSSLLWPRVLLFGDSITQGFWEDLARCFHRSVFLMRAPSSTRPGGARREPDWHDVAPAVHGRAQGQAYPHCAAPLCEAAWGQQCLWQGERGPDAGPREGQDSSSYLSDGLHLSPKGNEFLFSHLWPLIEKKVSSLPLLLPLLARHSRSKSRTTKSSGRWGPLVTENQVQLLIYTKTPKISGPRRFFSQV